VALKLIRHEQLGSSESLARLKREAEIVARIPHPGVVALFDSGELEDGTVFLVMELLRGADVGDLIERYGRGTPRQVTRLLREGGAVLEAAHRAGVLHRDIKPHNFFFASGPAGNAVKLLDFGLARPISLDRGITRHGAVVGTPAYMSPEQASGLSLDARSDLYSFAAVVSEALLGVPAAPGHEPGRIMRRVVEEEPEAPSEILAVLPPEVDAAFARAFRKEPADRPASVEAWVASFVSVLERIPPLTSGWTLPGATGRVRVRREESETREMETKP
jgi:serine/threonine protein kinase